MQEAYDTWLGISVTADEAIPKEPFRYECLCCGQEVIVAAPDSEYMSTHFRHKRGNSEKSCELYLGQVGIEKALSASQERKQNLKTTKFKIIYSFSKKIFSIYVSFPEEILNSYEKKSCEFCIYNSQKNKPDINIPINRLLFAPDTPSLFPIRNIQKNGYIDIKKGNVSWPFSVFDGAFGFTLLQISNNSESTLP